jgi:hypothetical protein
MNLTNAISSTPNAAAVAAPLVGNSKPTKRTKAKPASKPEAKRTEAAAKPEPKRKGKPTSTPAAAKPATDAKPEAAAAANLNEISAGKFAEIVGVTPVMLRRALRGIKHKRSTKRYVFDRSSPEFAALRASVTTWLETDARTKAGKAALAAAAAPAAATEKPGKRTKRNAS